jgi:radical SAM protein with 4Fe4S-binding SPASM domain
MGRFARGCAIARPSSRPVVLPGDSFGYYTDADRREPPWGGCSAGLFLCGITSDGGVKGCLSMPDIFIEDSLRRRDLWDIWFDPAAFRYNRQFSIADLGPHCRSCDRAQECGGGCSSMSYACTGGFHNDPFCFYRMESRLAPKPGIHARAPAAEGSGQRLP